jgi:hypothetical protein
VLDDVEDRELPVSVIPDDESRLSGERSGPRSARSVVWEIAVRLVRVASAEIVFVLVSAVARVTSTSFESASRISMFRT